MVARFLGEVLLSGEATSTTRMAQWQKSDALQFFNHFKITRVTKKKKKEGCSDRFAFYARSWDQKEQGLISSDVLFQKTSDKMPSDRWRGWKWWTQKGIFCCCSKTLASCTEPRIQRRPTEFTEGSAFWTDLSWCLQFTFQEEKWEFICVEQALHHILQKTEDVTQTWINWIFSVYIQVSKLINLYRKLCLCQQLPSLTLLRLLFFLFFQNTPLFINLYLYKDHIYPCFEVYFVVRLPCCIITTEVKNSGLNPAGGRNCISLSSTLFWKVERKSLQWWAK